MNTNNADVRIIASDGNWIEGDAVRQLEKTAEWEGMRLAVGMPDLHPGKGAPVGAAFVSEGIFYPFLVGGDVGCGMALWRTDLSARKLKLDRWESRLRGLESSWEGNAKRWLEQDGVEPTGFEEALGTIGGGNHFAELQKVEEVVDAAAFEALGLDRGSLLILVHSGSRGLGESILRRHTDRFAAAGLREGSDEADDYLQRHGHAMAWARSNRRLIAHRFMESIGADGDQALDLCHNNVTQIPWGDGKAWLHRKGAAPADLGAVVIPGSRGTMSYLVMPDPDQPRGAWSLAHGAGRKWSRGDARERLERFSAASLTRTDLGGRVICEDKRLLYEEAPQAYKNIDVVIQDLIDAGLCRTIAILRPLISYKIRR